MSNKKIPQERIDYGDSTSKQRIKISKYHTPEELQVFIKEEGHELSDEELEHVSGGGIWDDLVYTKCPKCGSDNVSIVGEHILSCKDCSYYGSY